MAVTPIPAKTAPTRLPLYASAPGFRTTNDYDRCLIADKVVFDKFMGNCTYEGDIDAPWISLPGNGRRINKTGSLVVGDGPFIGVNQAVLTYLVPVGYDGIIDTIVCNVMGANNGFVEGSGTITWRLAANQRYLRDLGNIQFSRGSLLTPVQTSNSGNRIYSGNLITFYVSISAAAAGVIDPNAVIVCAALGYIYPR